MLDSWMVARSIAIRFHPNMSTCIQVDRGDAAIRRFKKRQAAWTSDEFASPMNVTQVRGSIARMQIRGKRAGYGWHVQNACFHIPRSAIPVRATDRAWQLPCSLAIVRTFPFDRRRCKQWADDVSFRNLYSFGSKLRREVDKIIDRYSLPFEWRGFRGERLRG